jgi:hypothetical protein
MKRLLVIVAAVAALAAPASALAHPLGNFTVNRHTEIELSGGRVYVHYALDLAEIPTFQLGTRVRGSGFGAEAARGLELWLDGRRAPLRLLERRVIERAGAGGLKTLRYDAVYAAPGSGSRLAFRDRNFPSRIGWREVVVRAEEGAELRSASVRAAATVSAPIRTICCARRSTSSRQPPPSRSAPAPARRLSSEARPQSSTRRAASSHSYRAATSRWA